MNDMEQVDIEKMNDIKEELLKSSEEFINEQVKTSQREKVEKLFRLVTDKYDI